jgi:uncharacterized RDD family membrane protein YckC
VRDKPLSNPDNAKLKKRFLALILDYLVFVCYGVILFCISMFIYFVILDGIPNFNELEMNLVSLSLIVPIVLYSIIMESCKQHATLGKRIMKIKVASITSDHVRFWQITIRNIIKFLPWQLAHMAIFHAFTLQWKPTPLWTVVLITTDVLPFLWIGFLFRKDHRGLHDLIAKTVVENEAF